MKTHLYKKIGRKYEEVGEYDPEFIDYVPNGTHMIVKEKGLTTRRYNVDPHLLPLLAAMIIHREDLYDAFYQASKARPPKEEHYTPKQYAAWKKLEKELGGSRMYLTYPSAHDIVEAAIMSLSEKVDKMLSNETLKEAYEQFMLLAKLSATNDQVER